MSKPTIVLIPGAWHSPSHYAPLLNALEAAGYRTKSLRQPSVSPEDYNYPTLEVEAAFAREQAILPELEKNNVIVIGHSYGGVVLGAACKGLGKGERKAGENVVLGLVYMCALLGFTGQPFVPSRDKLAPFVLIDDRETGMVCTVDNPAEVMYNLVEDQEYVQEAVRTIGTHSYQAFGSVSPPQCWEDEIWNGKRVYIRCEHDRAVPVGVQDMLRDLTKVSWEVEPLAAGHSPFASHVKELVAIVDKYSAKWD